MKQYYILEGLASGVYAEDFKRCYKHFNELVCYVALPRCDQDTKQIIHPCKETCYELKEACLDPWISSLGQIPTFKDNIIGNWKYNPDKWSKNFVDCDYLPSNDGSIPCFYKQVICQNPPDVRNANINVTNSTYTAKSEIEYKCQSGAFQMEGNSTSTCLYSGHWSRPPKCKPKKASNTHPLIIVLPLFVVPFSVVMGTIIVSRFTSRKDMQCLTRQREFDAFVCYNFDTDREFAEEVILTELQENYVPPFKLCIHSKDFMPGVHIKDNITEAIRNSNSAIIVLSRGFVDSIWCREEFSDCYIENMKDPAFRLFVILVEPLENLTNLSEYMKSFVSRQTFLPCDDPQLFQKIGDYLQRVKEPRDTKNNSSDDIPEEDPEIVFL